MGTKGPNTKTQHEDTICIGEQKHPKTKTYFSIYLRKQNNDPFRNKSIKYEERKSMPIHPIRDGCKDQSNQKQMTYHKSPPKRNETVKIS